MHILYKITFIPHLNTKYPKYYIGSKFNYKGNYFGSVDSKQKYDYTEGLSLKEWWKKQKEKKENFLFEIIESYEQITTKELVEKEHNLHIKLNVLGEEYFNHSIATKGYCSIKNSEETKKLKSQKTKEYWNTEEGKNKKQRLIERNKLKQSEFMKNKWKNPSKKMKERKTTGRPKGSKNLPGFKKKESKKIFVDGIIFENAYEAAKVFKISPINIRRRCRINYEGKWRYN